MTTDLGARWWAVATLAGAAVVTAVDAVLVEKSEGFFRGGFLSQDGLTGPADTLLFLAVSFLADAAVIGAVIALLERLLRLTRLHPRARIAAGFLAGAGGLVAYDAVMYEVLRFLGDAFDFGLMFDLVGRNIGEILAVVVGYLWGPLVAACLACAAGMAIVWTTHRRSNPAHGGGVPLRPAAALALAGVIAVALAATASDVLANGLLRKPAGQLIAAVLNQVTDVDRDGFGLMGRTADPGVFDSSVFPYAVDVPGNGVDEDGVAGDLDAGTAPYADAPVAARTGGGGPDVILVLLESFRADLVGSRKHGRAVTPVLDALAARGARWSSAVSHNGYTVQSRFHLFTGGLAGRPGAPTLIDDFKSRGYHVVSVSGQDESFGGPLYDVGFRRSDAARDATDDRAERYTTSSTAGSLAVPLSVVVRNARQMVGAAPVDRPLFLYVNFHDTHFPYWYRGIEPLVSDAALPRERIVPDEREALQDTYANTAANVDRAIGELVDLVRSSRGREPGVIVTSDHGESLFDEGFLGHGYSLNDAQTRVPLVVANLGVQLPEPFVQTDLRRALLQAVDGPPGALPHAVARDRSDPVFQYLGDLLRPRQVAFLRADGRFVYDFRRQRVQPAGRGWMRPDELPAEDRAQFVELVHHWERVHLARAAAWRRARA